MSKSCACHECCERQGRCPGVSHLHPPVRGPAQRPCRPSPSVPVRPKLQKAGTQTAMFFMCVRRGGGGGRWEGVRGSERPLFHLPTPSFPLLSSFPGPHIHPCPAPGHQASPSHRGHLLQATITHHGQPGQPWWQAGMSMVELPKLACSCHQFFAYFCRLLSAVSQVCRPSSPASQPARHVTTLAGILYFINNAVHALFTMPSV